MLTWAGIVGGVFAGLWLMTWVVQIAAYAMFALAWIGWQALKVALVLAGAALAGGLLLFGSETQKRDIRAAMAGARAAGPRMRLA